MCSLETNDPDSVEFRVIRFQKQNVKTNNFYTMKKKVYITPTINEEDTMIEQLLTTISDPTTGITSEENPDQGNEPNLSRQHSVWGDENGEAW